MATDKSPVGPPPEWLNAEGQEVWNYLVDALGDTLDRIDRPTFVQMCAAYGTAEAAQKDLHTRGVLVKGRTKDHSADEYDEDGDVIQPAMVKNPAEAIARQAMTQFLMFAKEFGLTPGARKRMQIELAKRAPQGPEPEID